MSTEFLIQDWVGFYRLNFGIHCNFSDRQIPKKPEGFDRLLIVPQGFTAQRLFNKCNSLFPCWKGVLSLDQAVPINDRAAKSSPYAVWLRDRVEADEELECLSVNDLKAKSISGITLLERLIYEFKYFKETGKHLDVESMTICSGSRSREWLIPVVHWSSSGGVNMLWTYPDSRYDNWRVRAVVTC